MAAYAVSATLHGGVAHPPPLGHDALASELLTRLAVADEAAHTDAGADPIDLIGRPLDQAIAEWLAGVGESWSQLTFFLFDPDSWR